MRNKMKVRKGDRVIVVAGKDKGKRGEIIRAIPAERRVIVQGVNVVKRHTKPSAASPGGLVEKEAPIHVSNVALLDPKEDKPTRVGIKTLDDGRRVRFARRSGEVLDR
jgi:large subunit ribosomal protein L24